MKWQEFESSAWMGSEKPYDMMLTDPPYGTPESESGAGTEYDTYLDDADMRAVAQFGNRHVVAGGAVVIFTSLRYAWAWHTKLSDCD